MNTPGTNPDQLPAHNLWVELSTRITSQPLHFRSGNEETAAESVHQLFKKTREMMANYPDAKKFHVLALKLLNNTLRPYTARWHRWMTTTKPGPNSALIFKDEQVRRLFRAELIELQEKLSHYQQALKALADGEDIPEKAQQAIDRFNSEKKQAQLGSVIHAASSSISSNEHSDILARRKQFDPQFNDQELINATGLALSGGGIRSATFCLGIIQTLAKKDLFHQFDYLSTVSGGGYLGTFLSSILADEDQIDQDQKPKDIIDQVLRTPLNGKEPKAIRHLRNSSKYLGAGGIEWMAGLMVFGVLMNILLLLPVPLLLASIVYLFKNTGLWDIPLNTMPIWTGLQPNIVGHAFSWLLIILCVIGLFLPVVQSLTQGRHKSSFRDNWEYLTLSLTKVTLGTAVIYYLPSIFETYACWKAKFPAIWQMIIAGLVPFLLAYGSKLLEAWKSVQKIVLKMFELSGPVFFLMIFLIVGNQLGIGLAKTFVNQWSLPDWLINIWPPLNQHADALLITFGALVLWLWAAYLVNINTTSPHRYYRNRLCECYLIKRKDRNNNEARQKMSLGSLFQGKQAAPYHLINTTINLTTSQNPELRGRNGDFFLISKHICGSSVTGYYSTKDVVGKNPHLDLGSAMAISGAAASTGMGWQTMTSYRFLMGLLNIRLGYWLLNPDPKDKVSCPLFEGPGPGYLYKEVFGLMNEKDRYLNLSDGGHIENLAAYELLRRKCKFIVCVDGGQEPGMECADLIRLQRYAEIDLGIRMEYDLSDLQLNKNRLSKAYAVLVKIIYSEPAQDKVDVDWSQTELGWMLYIKLAMTGTEPAYISDYRRQNPSFPHQTTADQFFDEAQFEAYRMLGEGAAESLFQSEIIGYSTPATLHDWFQELANNLLADNDPVFN